MCPEDSSDDSERGHSNDFPYDSFRSLPIYNLVSLEYIRSVLPTDLEISHVFYGCYELSRNQDTTPLVDIGSLMRVLRMTQAVEEFRHTGRVDTLIRSLPEATDEFIRILSDFDWAMQCNSAIGIQQNVGLLIDFLEKEKEQEPSLYKDACSMMLDVLREDLLQASKKENSLSEYWKELDRMIFPRATREMLICRWHLKLNRYGQAALIAHEALRSILVQWYLPMKALPVSAEACADEKIRRNALDHFKRQVKAFEKDTAQTDEEKLFCNLERQREGCQGLRNRFAHILPTPPVENEKVCLEEFCRLLEKILDLTQNEIAALYQTYSAPIAKPKKACASLSQNDRIVICFDPKEEDKAIYDKFSKSKQKQYNVYVLNKKISKYIHEMPNLEKAEEFLRDIEADSALRAASAVVLYHLTPKEMMYVFRLMTNLGCKNPDYYPALNQSGFCTPANFAENDDIEFPVLNDEPVLRRLQKEV